MSKGIFVIGTGTDVGKTYVTGLILKKLHEAGKSAGYYKAAISGNEKDENGQLIPHDPTTVKNMSGIEQDTATMCPYVYERAVSPHLASKIEGNPVDMDVVMDGYKKVCEAYDYVTMEGSGGILCPIRFDEKVIWLEDIIRESKLPCLLICDAGLGTINQVVLTCEYMKNQNIPVKGIIFNNFHKGDVMEEDNIKMCELRTGISVVARVSVNSADLDMDVDKLAALYE